MADRDTTTGALRERLTDLLADWGAEMSSVITELEQARNRLDAMDAESARRDKEIAELGQRVRGQDELIGTLKGDAEAVAELRRELRERDLEIERLSSQLERSQELIDDLRGKAD